MENKSEIRAVRICYCTISCVSREFQENWGRKNLVEFCAHFFFGIEIILLRFTFHGVFPRGPIDNNSVYLAAIEKIVLFSQWWYNDRKEYRYNRSTITDTDTITKEYTTKTL